MAKLSMKLKQKAPAKFSTRKYNRCKRGKSVPCCIKKDGERSRAIKHRGSAAAD